MTLSPLRLLIYDRTCRGPTWLWGLSHCWHAGGWLYRQLDRLDYACGVASWIEALDWLLAIGPGQMIQEIQFWGHGKWGMALVDGQALTRAALENTGPCGCRLATIQQRLVPDGEALWWFRTCETFGGTAGHDFAQAWSDFFGCRCAGHTFIIGYYQSGLHSLIPGQHPHWSPEEGLREGTAEHPVQGSRSRRSAPNTITCLQGRIPSGY